MLQHDLRRFVDYCRGVIIHIADEDDLFTVEDVRKNGFEEEDRYRHPDFVQIFWKDMMDPLDIEIDDSADNYVCRRLT